MSLTRYSGAKISGRRKLLVIGDVHLGNALNPAPDVIRSLYKMFPKDHEADALDEIVIEGDLFDKGLQYHSEYMNVIQSWMIGLLNYCKRHNVALRVLEGTPSHDMNQSANFEPLAELVSGVDFKYFDDLAIETKSDGTSVLYVPDEWGNGPEHVYRETKKLLALHGLEQVDYIVMHGAFAYQLPYHVEGTHEYELWAPLARDAIFIGHIHQQSRNGVVVASGSFDRMCHGDEKPKGYTIAELSDSGNTFTFVENIHAKIFATLDVRGLSVDDALNKIEGTVLKKSYPPKSHIRVRCKNTDNTSSAKDWLREQYPQFYWDVDIVRDDVMSSDTGLLPEVSYVATSLTKNNLSRLLGEKLRGAGIECTYTNSIIAKLEELCLEMR